MKFFLFIVLPCLIWNGESIHVEDKTANSNSPLLALEVEHLANLSHQVQKVFTGWVRVFPMHDSRVIAVSKEFAFFSSTATSNPEPDKFPLFPTPFHCIGLQGTNAKYPTAAAICTFDADALDQIMGSWRPTVVPYQYCPSLWLTKYGLSANADTAVLTTPLGIKPPLGFGNQKTKIDYWLRRFVSVEEMRASALLGWPDANTLTFPQVDGSKRGQTVTSEEQLDEFIALQKSVKMTYDFLPDPTAVGIPSLTYSFQNVQSCPWYEFRETNNYLQTMGVAMAGWDKNFLEVLDACFYCNCPLDDGCPRPPRPTKKLFNKLACCQHATLDTNHVKLANSDPYSIAIQWGDSKVIKGKATFALDSSAGYWKVKFVNKKGNVNLDFTVLFLEGLGTSFVPTLTIPNPSKWGAARELKVFSLELAALKLVFKFNVDLASLVTIEKRAAIDNE